MLVSRDLQSSLFRHNIMLNFFVRKQTDELVISKTGCMLIPWCNDKHWGCVLNSVSTVHSSAKAILLLWR